MESDTRGTEVAVERDAGVGAGVGGGERQGGTEVAVERDAGVGAGVGVESDTGGTEVAVERDAGVGAGVGVESDGGARKWRWRGMRGWARGWRWRVAPGWEQKWGSLASRCRGEGRWFPDIAGLGARLLWWGIPGLGLGCGVRP